MTHPHKLTEAQIQAAIIRILHANRWLVVRINSGSFKGKGGHYVPTYRIPSLKNASEGHPDLVAYHRSDDGITARSLFVEVKKDGGRLSKSQKAFIDHAATLGVPVHVCDDWFQVHKLVQQVAQSKRSKKQGEE